MTLKPN
jgi:hypothetical protein